MGAEASCTVTFKQKTVAGKARLETDVLQFRGGDVRLNIPFKDMKRVTVRDSILNVTFGEGRASFELGSAAAKWREKILHPPSRLAKLGVKPGLKVAALGVTDTTFVKELETSGATVSIGRITRGCDVIFFGATREGELSRLSTLTKAMRPDGAIWIVRPKGRPEISERAVMAAGKAAGLVDVKVVSFSPTHTAEKFVIPVSQR